MEKAKQEKEAHGEIETAHPGYLGAQDTYYVGTIKSIGRIYLQTFIDTYTKVAFAKLYDRKNALVSADMLPPVISLSVSATDSTSMKSTVSDPTFSRAILRRSGKRSMAMTRPAPGR